MGPRSIPTAPIPSPPPAPIHPGYRAGANYQPLRVTGVPGSPMAAGSIYFGCVVTIAQRVKISRLGLDIIEGVPGGLVTMALLDIDMSKGKPRNVLAKTPTPASTSNAGTVWADIAAPKWFDPGIYIGAAQANVGLKTNAVDPKSPLLSAMVGGDFPADPTANLCGWYAPNDFNQWLDSFPSYYFNDEIRFSYVPLIAFGVAA